MGTELALFTMKVFLATLFRSYRVEAGRGQPYDEGQRYFFGVRMPWGIRARLQR
jgi:cytochrome P450